MANLPSAWLSDPAWCAMDATTRGLHTQLLLLAAQTEGFLPEDEPLWRQWLGIPAAGADPALPTLPAVLAQWVNEGAPHRLAQLGGEAVLMEHYWEQRWLPALRRVWRPIGEGRVTCALAQALASPCSSPGAPETQVADRPSAAPARRRSRTPSIPSKRSKALAKPLLTAHSLEQFLTPSGPQSIGMCWAVPLNERFSQADQVLARWHVPATRAARLNLWSVGLALLSCQPGDETSNRSFLSSLISQYGERRVGAALGEMSGRNVPPVEPKAFLRALLRRDTEGSAAAQKAREVRAGIPL